MAVVVMADFTFVERITGNCHNTNNENNYCYFNQSIFGGKKQVLAINWPSYLQKQKKGLNHKVIQARYQSCYYLGGGGPKRSSKYLHRLGANW